MKNLTLLLASVGAFGLCFTSNANITGASWNDDGDGAVVCTGWSFSTENNQLSMWGTQYWAPAHMLGTILTDTPDDPTLTLGSSVNNDTGYMWIGYQVNVVMSVPFTFTAPGPTVSNPPTDDWTVANVVAPTLQVTGPYAGDYEGTLQYSDGTPVGIGGELDFLYSIHFASSTDYSFTQEMIPLYAPVPEPGVFALAGMGSLLFGLYLRRNRG
jgi:hypothetical protein